jgi:Protein of unknown function (DUF2846)
MRLLTDSVEKALIGKNRGAALLATCREPEATAFQVPPPNESFAPASSSKFRPVMLFLLVLTTACSSVQTGQQPSSASVPSPNSATVYFYRLQNASGAAVGVDIKDNGIDIGTLQDGTYFVYHAAPGQHTLTATTDTTSTRNVKLQAGATYYMKASVVSSRDLFHPRSIRLKHDLSKATDRIWCPNPDACLPLAKHCNAGCRRDLELRLLCRQANNGSLSVLKVILRFARPQHRSGCRHRPRWQGAPCPDD